LIELSTLDPGEQAPSEVAARVAGFLGAAERSLELALYDIRLPDPVGTTIRDAIEGAAARGVEVRLAYNLEQEEREVAVPPPPRTEPELIESLRVPTRGIRDPRPHAPQVRGS
jgi:phosphatidylserine/phosphatidylglycerophosphate/cardiolipin synthase-like enzyme